MRFLRFVFVLTGFSFSASTPIISAELAGHSADVAAEASAAVGGGIIAVLGGGLAVMKGLKSKIKPAENKVKQTETQDKQAKKDEERFNKLKAEKQKEQDKARKKGKESSPFAQQKELEELEKKVTINNYIKENSQKLEGLKTQPSEGNAQEIKALDAKITHAKEVRRLGDKIGLPMVDDFKKAQESITPATLNDRLESLKNAEQFYNANAKDIEKANKLTRKNNRSPKEQKELKEIEAKIAANKMAWPVTKIEVVQNIQSREADLAKVKKDKEKLEGTLKEGTEEERKTTENITAIKEQLNNLGAGHPEEKNLLTELKQQEEKLTQIKLRNDRVQIDLQKNTFEQEGIQKQLDRMQAALPDPANPNKEAKMPTQGELQTTWRAEAFRELTAKSEALPTALEKLHNELTIIKKNLPNLQLHEENLKAAIEQKDIEKTKEHAGKLMEATHEYDRLSKKGTYIKSILDKEERPTTKEYSQGVSKANEGPAHIATPEHIAYLTQLSTTTKMPSVHEHDKEMAKRPTAPSLTAAVSAPKETAKPAMTEPATANTKESTAATHTKTLTRTQKGVRNLRTSLQIPAVPAAGHNTAAAISEGHKVPVPAAEVPQEKARRPLPKPPAVHKLDQTELAKKIEERQNKVRAAQEVRKANKEKGPVHEG